MTDSREHRRPLAQGKFTKQRIKFGAWLLVLILVLIFVLQNIHSVSMSYWFWSFQWPLALVIVITLVVGMLLGWALPMLSAWRPRSKK